MNYFFTNLIYILSYYDLKQKITDKITEITEPSFLPRTISTYTIHTTYDIFLI